MSSQELSITKEDLKNIKDEIIHEFHRSAEIISAELKLLAERIFALNKKDRFGLEIKNEVENKTQPIAQTVIALQGQASALQGQVTTLDAKVDRSHLELKTEIQESRQEILAAVKFSYAELDKCRLATSPP